jgi:hypothetical protein
MALRDISNVTTTLMNLIDRAFRVPENWPASMAVPRVLSEPPVRSKSNGIGIFLYHITEHPHYKNLPAPGHETPPVRYTSLALTLYYQLSAYHDSIQEGEQDGLMEQQMLAVAMKAMHDYPEINDTTKVFGALDTLSFPIEQVLFPEDIIGRSNRFKITYQPIQPHESISFWTTGDAKLTLSAYYEVNVVLLEPETTRTRSGIVLDYNVFTFASGNPKILNSSNDVSFTSPVDGRVRHMILQPAQVAPAPASPPDVAPFTFTLKGLDFIGNIQLRLTNALWDEPATTDAAWQVAVSTTTINAVARESAIVERTGAPIDILPGIYGVQVVAQSIKYKSDGSQWPIELTSNVSPFAIVPRIDSLGLPPNLLTAATVTGYLFSYVLATKELIKLEVYIGQDRLTQVFVAPNAGEFQITGLQSLAYRFPATTVSGEVLPFRVFANGAESAPQWITAP